MCQADHVRGVIPGDTLTTPSVKRSSCRWHPGQEIHSRLQLLWTPSSTSSTSQVAVRRCGTACCRLSTTMILKAVFKLLQTTACHKNMGNLIAGEPRSSPQCNSHCYIPGSICSVWQCGPCCCPYFKSINLFLESKATIQGMLWASQLCSADVQLQ